MARAMKDSGIAWIGEMPQDWEVRKVKHYYKMQTGFTPDSKNSEYYDGENGYDWVTIGDLSEVHVINNTKSKISNLYIQKYLPKIIPKGSLLYSFKLSVGQVAFAGKDIYSNEAIASFLDGDDKCLDFLYYSSFMIINNASENIYGAKLLNQDLIKNAYIIFPPIQAQQRIADYLDHKCKKIDNIIENTKATIEEYKKYKQSVITEAVTKGLNPNVEMKDSGIEWIGEIPIEFKTVKLKRYSYIKYGLGEPPELSDNGLPIIRATNIERGHIIKNNLIKAKLEDIPSSKDVILKEGDIIIVRSGAYAGDVAYISKEWEGALAGYDMIISINTVNSKFIAYALLSEYVLKAQLYLSRMRSAQPHLNTEQVGEVTLVIPPNKEQYKIVEYLDKKNSEIDNVIAKKQESITELESYKKSLIYECVTGKKEV